ncbi:hypothetical protein SMSKK35_4049 [Stenotrophomonas maltophilia SKK35]|nr:hypothetical protein SMSKK35_4049 [Stenotrophomonas maltophilia SKK35]
MVRVELAILATLDQGASVVEANGAGLLAAGTHRR